MSQKSNDLEKWFSGRPRWLQVAANRLFEKNKLSEDDFVELTSLCRKEACGELSKSTSLFPVSAFSQKITSSLRLCSISGVEGVNALAPKNPLNFGGSNIAIVYGDNGSGKSGYVRLLKHICGAREAGTLYPNVYNSGPVLQKACISYKQDGISKIYNWIGKGICSDLNSVDIFDTSFGRVFVSSEDEVSYEPPVLSFFSSLISLCEKVASRLDDELNKHKSLKTNMPIENKITAEGKWYEGINAQTTPQEIDRFCAFGDSEKIELKTLQQRLAEQDPGEKAKELRKKKQYVDGLINDAKKYSNQLSRENFNRVISAKKKAVLKKKTAELVAEKMFSGSELDGIGSDVWKELWEAARKYSIWFAYKEIEYPNISEGSRCVLCHQTLSEEAKKRLISFDNFVKGEMEKAALNAAKEYEAVVQAIELLPSSSILKARIDASGLPHEVADQVMDFFAKLQEGNNLLFKIESEEHIPDFSIFPIWDKKAQFQSKNLEELAKKYEEDAKIENREELKKRVSGLQARKWLFENRSTIEKEVDRLNLRKQLQEAKKLTNTRALSQKKGELAEVLITDAFVQRFNQELKALDACRIKVELLKTKVLKGRVLHKLQLRGASRNNLVDVLSEGENRIISIAAFLADVTGNSSRAPFIFDDPISSLDQNYEEAVVQRLIDLAQERQVIVFTHRLSLLGTLRHFAEKKNIKPDVVSIRSVSWGAGEPAPIPISQSEIKSTLNTLMNQRYQEAKKESDGGNFERAEILIKSICSDFRILLERSIENDLLCGVVQRFQRPVHTLKIKELAKLKGSDCSFLDSLMTKYSNFEHSQSVETPVALPNPEEIFRDMESLKKWREEYAGRN